MRGYKYVSKPFIQYTLVLDDTVTHNILRVRSISILMNEHLIKKIYFSDAHKIFCMCSQSDGSFRFSQSRKHRFII